MTTPTLILIVDGDTSDWWQEWTPDGRGVEARREWVPVETLPEVRDPDGCVVDGKVLYIRPLRAGDTVSLAQEDDIGAGQVRVLPFATAEVAEVLPVEQYVQHACVGRYMQNHEFPVTSDELPGDWSSARFGIRVTNVEAL